VERVEAYRTVPDLEGAALLRRALAGDRVDVITFASPSAVECFSEHVGARIGRAAVAVIGPITAAAAERLGIAVALSATEFTAAGLVAALVSYAGGQRSGGSGVSP
jgi:uroporphyrinogen-III synthase